MTEISVSAATNIVQTLVDRAIDETRYLCCVSNIAKDYENEKKKLMTKQKSVEDDVNEAKDKNEEIVIDVKDWQCKATNMVWEDTKAKKSCFFGLLPNCILLYRRGKDLERKAQEIKKLIENCKFDKFSRPIEPPGVEYYSSEDFIRFESRNFAQEQLHEALKNDDNYMVGLHGIGGCGKTKLVIQVGNEVQKSKLLDKVIFVVVSNPPNVRKIQDDIASQLALSLNGNESERSKKLWSRLRNGQEILIILDDVWEKLNFENIGIPSRNNHEGCRVLLTTRDLNVCKSMECQKTIHLELLPETEAWILFQRFAEISDKSSQTLKDVAQNITSECKGLPVAITAMASTLKGQPLEDWRGALITLQSSIPIDNIHEDLKHVYKCLRVSYDNLKSDKAKGLFLLCSMFPEDHEIPNEELIRYAIGIGLFGELESYQTTRTNVRLTKAKLIDSCLLLETEGKRCVKMHDLVRDVAHEIANNEIHETMEPKRTLQALHGDTTMKQNKIRYLYCHSMNDFSYRLDLPNLEILILVCSNGVSVPIPDAFFDGMKGIKVLTLKGEYKGYSSSIQLMPISIEVLNNLRTLDLRNCILGDISVLRNLQRIETLELYYCSINELSNGILELKKLRLFKLESCRINGNPYKVIGGFSEIEELYFMCNYISNGEVDSGAVADLFNKNRISPALKRYHIEVGHPYVLPRYLNDLIARALAIAHFNTSISNATIQDLMQRAEVLCLKNLEGGCKSILPDFVKAIGGAMTELIKLELYDCLEIECLIDTTRLSSSSGTVFSNLIALVVSKMRNLKELCRGSTPFDFLKKPEDLTIGECGRLQNSGLFVGNLNLRRLQKLRVDSCPKLTYLFLVSIAQSLVLLEDIKIEFCHAMKCIIKDETEEIVHADHDRRTTLDSMLPKLTTVAVSFCRQLELFLSVGSNKRQMSDSTGSSTDSGLEESNLEIHINLPTLEEVKLFHLPNMISICTKKYHATCPSLKNFHYVGCPQFAIIEFIEHSNARQLKCNGIESEEFLKQYRQELQAGEQKQKFFENASPNGTEYSMREQSINQPNSMGQEEDDVDNIIINMSRILLQSIEERVKQSVKKIPDYEEIPTSSLVNSEPRNSQSITVAVKESFRDGPMSEKSKIATSLTNCAPRILPPRSLIIPTQNALSHESESEQSISQPNSMGHKKKDVDNIIINMSLILLQSIDEIVKQSVKKISNYEKIPTSSLINSEPRNSQSSKGSIQEDPASTKVKIGTPSCPSSELGHLMPYPDLASLPKTSSKEPMEHEEVDFHGLFKIDSRRASLLDDAFAKYPHLWEWQKSIPPKFCKGAMSLC